LVRTAARARLIGGEDGTAIIEAAVIVLVLMILILGVFAFSWLFYRKRPTSPAVTAAAVREKFAQ
jgi:Flp pilus assembly protein TadG